MKFQTLALSAAMTAALVACGGGSNDTVNVDVGGDTGGDTSTEIPAPSTYTFDSQFTEGESAVKYTGQTARHMLIEALVSEILGYTSKQPETDQASIESALEFYFDGSDALDVQAITFSKDGVEFLPVNDSDVTTFGSISTRKNLVGKIAGNDTAMNAGKLQEGLVNGEFFGWDDGVFTATGLDGAKPEDFTRHLFSLLAEEVVSVNSVQVTTTSSSVGLNTIAYVDSQGRDFRQLIQKFLLGAITFSQGTSDYLQTDFSADNVQDGENPYTSGAHDWDEAFGYFGAARDYNTAYDDDSIADVGYFDTNTDTKIDLTSEINLGNSSNCAKRDRGAVNDPNFTKTVFDAFIAGRTILNNAEKAAAEAGAQVDLTAEQLTALTAAGDTVALTWEKCVAATVVHYINDTTADLEELKANGGTFTDLEHFTDLAKHWAEMKGFALGLQFNVESPIYASDANLASFKAALADMGTGPVPSITPIAQGTTTGEIDTYLGKLATARDAFQSIYSFDAENVANW
jgi:hypothetical protein